MEYRIERDSMGEMQVPGRSLLGLLSDSEKLSEFQDWYREDAN